MGRHKDWVEWYGPWETEESETPWCGIYVYDTTGSCICATVSDSDRDKRVAAMISAAPDMLEALENLENDDEHMPESAWAMVQAAIDKAYAKKGK